MPRHAQYAARLAVLAVLVTAGAVSSAIGQMGAQAIQARVRVFPASGPGVSALKRDAAGRYYILAEPDSAISVYSPEGRLLGQIPGAQSHGARIVYAQDFDLGDSGRVYVADRGANAVKIFSPDGALETTIPIAAPTSVVALPGGEFAVAALHSDYLVNIYNLQGKLVRRFGDPSEASGNARRAAAVALGPGRLYGDSSGHIYFAFANFAVPTIRRYDRYGYASAEMTIPQDSGASQQADHRWDTVMIEGNGVAPPARPQIRAVGVDPTSQEVWSAIGTELACFDQEGNLVATYRAVTRDGASITPSAILIEQDRILLAANPQGIYEFALPANRAPVSPAQ